MIKEKERIRRRYIKKGRDQTSTEYRRFCELRASIKTKQEILYNVNINKIGDGMKTNPKRFWSFVNQKKSSSSLPKVMKYNNVLYKTTKTIATALIIILNLFSIHLYPRLKLCLLTARGGLLITLLFHI